MANIVGIASAYTEMELAPDGDLPAMQAQADTLEDLFLSATAPPEDASHSDHASAQHERHDEGLGDMHSTPAQDRSKPFFCPRCGVGYARAKELKRHVRESCEQSWTWLCPELGCGTRFNRVTRFKLHHKNVHNCAYTAARGCTHEASALRALPTRHAYGCGFCRMYFQDHTAFLLHFVKHCEDGRTREEYTVTNRIYGLLKRPDVQPTWLFIYPVDDLSLDWDKVEVAAFVDMLEGDLSMVALQARLLRLLALGRPRPLQQQYMPLHPPPSTSSDLDASVDIEDSEQAQSLSALRDLPANKHGKAAKALVWSNSIVAQPAVRDAGDWHLHRGLYHCLSFASIRLTSIYFASICLAAVFLASMFLASIRLASMTHRG